MTQIHSQVTDAEKSYVKKLNNLRRDLPTVHKRSLHTLTKPPTQSKDMESLNKKQKQERPENFWIEIFIPGSYVIKTIK